jgi:hypothetical protein
LERQTENTQKQIAAEQFKNAVDHLGNEKQSVVLGGVHALHNLATTFPEQYGKQVFEVLCSFIREETRKPEYQAKIEAMIESTDQTKVSSGETPTTWLILPNMSRPLIPMDSSKPATSLIVIQTIVDKLFRETFEYIDEKTGKTKELYREYSVNLRGAYLREIDFSLKGRKYLNWPKADLRNTDLQGAVLWEANLQGAELEKANLQETILLEADLRGAWLWEADLQGADLLKANLQGARLIGANLQGAELYGAKLDEDNRQRLIEKGIITEEDFPPPQQPDDESTSDEPTDSTDTQ